MRCGDTAGTGAAAKQTDNAASTDEAMLTSNSLSYWKCLGLPITPNLQLPDACLVTPIASVDGPQGVPLLPMPRAAP